MKKILNNTKDPGSNMTIFRVSWSFYDDRSTAMTLLVFWDIISSRSSSRDHDPKILNNSYFTIFFLHVYLINYKIVHINFCVIAVGQTVSDDRTGSIWTKVSNGINYVIHVLREWFSTLCSKSDEQTENRILNSRPSWRIPSYWLHYFHCFMYWTCSRTDGGSVSHDFL